jgi:hypothetical protein
MSDEVKCTRCGAANDPVVEIAQRELRADHRRAIERWLGLSLSPDTEPEEGR